MKIDKVIFSSSLEYAPFWNANSKVLKECLGLDSVCLLYGRKNELMSDQYGEIVECDYKSDLPRIVQLVLNKFYYTQNEPQTTWMIGDIDQLPLQSQRFIQDIEDIPDHFYVHLAENGNSIRISPESDIWKRHPIKSNNGNFQLPAHYHVAKGKTFKDFLNLDVPFEDYVNGLVKEKLELEGKYPFTAFNEVLQLEKQRFFWAYEENYTTDFLRRQPNLNRYTGFGRNTSIDRIDRSTNCQYNPSTLINKQYIDIHCPRPYAKHKEVIDKIIKQAWGIEL